MRAFSNRILFAIYGQNRIHVLAILPSEYLDVKHIFHIMYQDYVDKINTVMKGNRL